MSTITYPIGTILKRKGERKCGTKYILQQMYDEGKLKLPENSCFSAEKRNLRFLKVVSPLKLDSKKILSLAIQKKQKKCKLSYKPKHFAASSVKNVGSADLPGTDQEKRKKNRTNDIFQESIPQMVLEEFGAPQTAGLSSKKNERESPTNDPVLACAFQNQYGSLGEDSISPPSKLSRLSRKYQGDLKNSQALPSLHEEESDYIREPGNGNPVSHKRNDDFQTPKCKAYFAPQRISTQDSNEKKDPCLLSLDISPIAENSFPLQFSQQFGEIDEQSEVPQPEISMPSFSSDLIENLPQFPLNKFEMETLNSIVTYLQSRYGVSSEECLEIIEKQDFNLLKILKVLQNRHP